MAPHLQKRILVGLDLSSMDDYLLSYLESNAHLFTDQKITFLHVLEESEQGKTSGELWQVTTKKIKKHYKQHDIQQETGNPERALRLLNEQAPIDLVVLGHKPVSGDHVEIKKLVKKPFSSLLLIPERPDYTIHKVGVAFDFSDLSESVVQKATKLAKEADAELVGFHSYQVPSGYHKSGKDHWEFAEVMEQNARKECDQFLKKTGIDQIEMHYQYDEKEKPAECIADFARDQQIDLLVTGSKGRTEAASVLIGSVARNLTQELHDVPMLILKNTHQNMDLMDALKEV